jgi:hypothetical protein
MHRHALPIALCALSSLLLTGPWSRAGPGTFCSHRPLQPRYIHAALTHACVSGPSHNHVDMAHACVSAVPSFVKANSTRCNDLLTYRGSEDIVKSCYMISMGRVGCRPKLGVEGIRAGKTELSPGIFLRAGRGIWPGWFS